jgi:hypothetical protein
MVDAAIAMRDAFNKAKGKAKTQTTSKNHQGLLRSLLTNLLARGKARASRCGARASRTTWM